MVYNKIKKIIAQLQIFAVLAAINIFFLPEKIFSATSGTAVTTGSISTQLPTSLNLDKMLQKIRNYFFGIVIVACVFMILWAAFNMATAGEDEEKFKKAKKTILYALIGLVVAGMSAAIISIVEDIVMNTPNTL